MKGSVCRINIFYKHILTQLRVGLSKLNFHKFRHNFRDTVNPLCPANDGVEDTGTFPAALSFRMMNLDLIFSIVSMQYCSLMVFVSFK